VVQLQRVEGLVASTPAYAGVLTGGKRAPGRQGCYFEPTIITGLRQDDQLIQTELFVPVITVQEFPDAQSATRLANDVEFGPGASIWTANHQRATRLPRALDFGTVWIKRHLINPAEMPNAGFKHSGDGTDLSLLGLENYTRLKHVMRSRRLMKSPGRGSHPNCFILRSFAGVPGLTRVDTRVPPRVPFLCVRRRVVFLS